MAENLGDFPPITLFQQSPDAISGCSRIATLVNLLTLKAQIILIADDTDTDVVFLKSQFRAAKILNVLQVVTDGEKAICYLKGEGEFADREKFPYPILLFLDLKLPRVGGYEILDFLKSHEEHKNLPVIVLSGLGDLKHVNRAYQKGANSFLIKPVEVMQLINTIQSIKSLKLFGSIEGLRVEPA